MALYYEAASFLTPDGLASSDSLSARVYASRGLRSPPAQLYALLVESAKWSSVLSPVIESSDILKHERKLTPAISLLLVHDLLLSKRGIAAPKDHNLSQLVSRHRARLNAELTKARIKAGFATVQAWKESLETDNDRATSHHPRWVRVNSLKTATEHQLQTGCFQSWEGLSSIRDNTFIKNSNPQKYVLDSNIPDLLATPPGTDLTKSSAYRNGEIILQDKASCFSAYLLNPTAFDGAIIDGCSAPGNKTTHLAAILRDNIGRSQVQTIYAVERNKERSATLQKMVRMAGADEYGVQVLASQDFSRLDPEDKRFANVGAILLDPSCSGSGIVGRDQGDEGAALNWTLPNASARAVPSKKRKLNGSAATGGPTETALPADEDKDALETRLNNLAAFQLTLLKHAFSFPEARKVVYSTCSIHAHENEQVVLRALQSDIARERGWSILPRQCQVAGLKKWRTRGDADGTRAAAKQLAPEVSHDELDQIVEACIRCRKGTDEGTMGFFVVAFYRDMAEPSDHWTNDGGGVPKQPEVSEDEWKGFSDSGE